MPAIYKHDYHPLSIYGNVVSLLREHVSSSGIHLDIGCGYGAIAEPLRDELGLTYIGFDRADDGLESLRGRGFETHRLDLGEPNRCEAILEQAIGNRAVASLSFLDTLEHITNGEQVLALLRRVAARSNALLALSVPNVAHKDLALKLLLGRWDVTEDGLLDHTHVTLYTHARLSELMKAAGWRQLATRDWPLQYSDQYFPASAPVLDAASPIGDFLLQLVNRANPYAIVNQFVAVYRPDKPQPRPLLETRDEPNRPFLSVVLTVETQRREAQRKLLRQLTNQTSHDFELVLLHAFSDPETEIQQGLLRGLPILRGRTRFVSGAGLSRIDALNAAIARCAARYFTILDDADGLERDWVSTLIGLSEERPGAVLQVNQSSSDGRGNGTAPPAAAATHSHANGNGSIADEAMSLLPAFYRFARGNHGCFATLAMPTSAFRDLGLRFELQLPDGRGWDLAIDAILHCGLNPSDHRCVVPANSIAAPTNDLLGTSDISLLEKLNSHPILLATGAAERIEVLADAHAKLSRERGELHDWNNKLQIARTTLEEQLGRLSASNAALEARHARIVNGRPLLKQFIDASFPQWNEPVSAPGPDAPFLSVITRTRGQRPYTLRDTLMSLAGQTSQEFEVIVVVHSGDDEVQRAIREIIEEFPPSFRKRLRSIACTRPGRSSPINDGIAAARGRYVAMLDDDDIAFGHWVETFQTLAETAPDGSVLRAACTRQDFELTNAGSVPPVPRAVSWFKAEWPAAFDAVSHIHTNATPLMSVAYPIDVFRQDGLRFDEAMSTAEDWDLMMRATMARGVVATPQVTAIYRWGAADDVSNLAHSNEEWKANWRAVHKKLDQAPLLLPPGSASRVSSLYERLAEVEAELAASRSWSAKLEKDHAALRGWTDKLESEYAKLERDHLALRQWYAEVERGYHELEAKRAELEARRASLEQLIEERPVLRGLISAYCPRLGEAADPLAPDAPFLSIITRTQGKRPYTLRDTLMSLAAQTSDDFELVLVIHSDDVNVHERIRRIVDEFPSGYRARVNIVICTRPGRSSPLNDGIARARGHYVALLDDDDIALAHWVETFRKLAAEAPAGSVLRATCARQDFALTNTGQVPPVPRAVSWFTTEWPASFDAVSHIYENATPPMCVAYPAGVFRDDGLQFDETLNTLEDWDFMMRATMLRGMATTPEVTAIYRWGAAGDVSTVIYSKNEWMANRHVVQQKLDAKPVLLPAGSIMKVASAVGSSISLQTWYGSGSWRVTAPLRAIKKGLPRPIIASLRAVKRRLVRR